MLNGKSVSKLFVGVLFPFFPKENNSFQKSYLSNKCVSALPFMRKRHGCFCFLLFLPFLFLSSKRKDKMSFFIPLKKKNVYHLQQAQAVDR